MAQPSIEEAEQGPSSWIEREWTNVWKICEGIEEVFSLADRDHILYYAAANRLAEIQIASLKAVRL